MKTLGITGLVLLLVIGLNGCLTSPNSFFEQRDIIQNPSIVGTFVDRQEEATWEVSPAQKEPGRYEVTLHDHEVWCSFLGTLFQIGDVMYVDLVPTMDSSVHLDRSPSGEVPTLSQLAKLVFFERRHAVFRIAVTDTEMTYWMAAPDALRRLPATVQKPRNHENWRATVIEEPSSSLRDLLRNHGSELFTEMKVIQKRQR